MRSHHSISDARDCQNGCPLRNGVWILARQTLPRNLSSKTLKLLRIVEAYPASIYSTSEQCKGAVVRTPAIYDRQGFMTDPLDLC